MSLNTPSRKKTYFSSFFSCYLFSARTVVAGRMALICSSTNAYTTEMMQSSEGREKSFSLFSFIFFFICFEDKTEKSLREKHVCLKSSVGGWSKVFIAMNTEKKPRFLVREPAYSKMRNCVQAKTFLQSWNETRIENNKGSRQASKHKKQLKSQKTFISCGSVQSRL